MDASESTGTIYHYVYHPIFGGSGPPCSNRNLWSEKFRSTFRWEYFQVSKSSLTQERTQFQCLSFSAFIKPRNEQIWSSCYTPLPSLAPANIFSFNTMNRTLWSFFPSSCTTVSVVNSGSSALHKSYEENFSYPDVIYTNYDPARHKTQPFPSNREERTVFTESERLKAESSAEPTFSIADFKLKVIFQFYFIFKLILIWYLDSGSIERWCETWGVELLTPQFWDPEWVSTEIILWALLLNWKIRRRLELKGKKKDPLLLVVPDMPAELREPLMRHLQMAFEGKLCSKNSQDEKFEGFEAYHFVYWNRYSPRVRFSCLISAFNSMNFVLGRQLSSWSGPLHISQEPRQKKAQFFTIYSSCFSRASE